jgi:hypothetical protein
MNNDLFELFSTVRDKVNNNDHLQHLGRFCSTELMLQSGEQCVHLVIEHGRVLEVVKGPRHMRAWQFALRAQPQSWNEFWQPVPAVGFQDIFAMSRFGHLHIDGDIGPLLCDLRYIKDVLATPRHILDQTQVNPVSTRTIA